MNIDLSDEAIEYGRQALRALEAAGGDQLVQRAEADPAAREALVGPVLAELGAWDLDPRGDADELEAAAALCRSAGYWALPYPVAERLSPADRPRRRRAGRRRRHAARRRAVAGLDVALGRRHLRRPPQRATAVGRRADPRPAFVAQLDLDAARRRRRPRDVALGLVLPCWTLLGMLDRAMELTTPTCSDAPAVRPAAVGVPGRAVPADRRRGRARRARGCWPSTRCGASSRRSADALDDALALRLAALEAAEIVFRVTHQLHGAIGFCDETTLSWLSRYSQPLRRLPLGLSATRDAAHPTRSAAHGLTGSVRHRTERPCR